MQDDAEALLVLKTRAAASSRAPGRGSRAPPYQVPELIALPVEAGSAKYLAWIAAETG